MPKFSQNSYRKLNSCHPDLVTIFEEVVWMRDCTIVEGHRGEPTQNEYYRLGKSQVKYPDSNHNKHPSMAVDVMEYFPNKPHLHWFNKDEIHDFANYVISLADSLYENGEITHKVTWGGDWDMDGDTTDTSFFDGPHYQLYKPEDK